MTRCSRLYIDNACYHITTRGNGQQPVFHQDEDRIRYLNILKKAKRKYGIFLFAYCLMSNHIHLLVEAQISRNISKFMHWVNRGYTAYYNTKYEKVGHLWQGRFKSHPIVKGQYLVNAATYIENNPVRAGIAKDAADYRWSSYKERCLLSERSMLDEINIDCSFLTEGQV